MDSPDYHDADILRIVSWVLIVFVALCIGVKFALSTVSLREFHFDDGFLVAAAIFDLAFTIAISIAAPNGIGRNDSISASDTYVFEKAFYSSSYFFVISCFASQLSVILFFNLVTPITSHKIWLKILGSVIAVCSGVFLTTTAFPCSAPGIWMILQGNCIDQRANWTAYYVVSILIEVSILVVFTSIIWGRGFHRRHRIIVISAFGTRIMVVITLISTVAVLRDRHSTYEQAIRALDYNACRLLVVTTSVITVCLPHLRNMMLGLQTGMLQTGRMRLASKSRPATDEHSSGVARSGSGSVPGASHQFESRQDTEITFHTINHRAPDA